MKRLLSAGVLCAVMLAFAPQLDAADDEEPPNGKGNPACDVLRGLVKMGIPIPKMAIAVVCKEAREK